MKNDQEGKWERGRIDEKGSWSRSKKNEKRGKKMRKTMKKDKLLFIGINCSDMYANQANLLA